MSPAILQLAEKLATSRVRYLNDHQLGAYRSKAGVSFDDARRAAILADRLRRQRQAKDIATASLPMRCRSMHRSSYWTGRTGGEVRHEPEPDAHPGQTR
jgi:hypothetical protein